MRGQAVQGTVTPKTSRSWPVVAFPAGVRHWSAAAVVALIVLLLLPHFRPLPVVTLAAADLTARNGASGFYPLETDARGERYAWTGPSAAALFDFASHKPLTITVELRSAAIAGGPDTPVRLLMNNSEVTSVRPDPQQYDFQPYHVRVPRADDAPIQVGIASTPFGPRPGDGRKLGVMVRAITIDRTEAWSTIARRTWLYWLVPLCALLVTGGALRARHTRHPAVASLLGCSAVGIAGIATGAMLIATMLLLSIGALDRSTYYLWLLGSAYLAVFGAAVTLSLPLGGTMARPLGRRLAHLPLVHRHAGPLRAGRRVALFTGVLLFALSFFNSYGTGDVDRKLRWMGDVRASGVIKAYAGIPDQYPPLTLIMLAAAGHIGRSLHLSDFTAFKLSLVVLFALTGATFLWWRHDLLLTAALLLALIPNALALGYTDIYFAPTLVLALAALQRRRFVAFSLLLAVTCLIKWQAAIIAPPLLLAAVRLGAAPGDDATPSSSPLRELGAIVLPGLAVAASVLLVFGGAVFASLAHGFGERFLSANALNAPWLLTQALHLVAPGIYGGFTNAGRHTIQTTDLRVTLGPKLVFAATYLFALMRLWRAAPTFSTTLRWSLAAYLAYFAFNTGVHENHLFTAVLLAAALAAEGGVGNRAVFAVVAVAANLNLVLFYGLRGDPRLPPSLAGPLDWSTVLALTNVALVVTFFIAAMRTERRV